MCACVRNVCYAQLTYAIDKVGLAGSRCVLWARSAQAAPLSVHHAVRALSAALPLAHDATFIMLSRQPVRSAKAARMRRSASAAQRSACDAAARRACVACTTSHCDSRVRRGTVAFAA